MKDYKIAVLKIFFCSLLLASCSSFSFDEKTESENKTEEVLKKTDARIKQLERKGDSLQKVLKALDENEKAKK